MSDQTQPISTAELLPAQARLLFQSTATSILGVLINVLVLTIVLWSEIPLRNLLFWVVIMMLALLFRFASYKYYQANTNESLTSKSWLNLFYFGSLLTALGWGAGTFLLFPEGDVLYESFIIFIYAGVSAASITSLSYDKKISYSYLVCMLVPLAFHLSQNNGDIGSLMAAIIIAYLLVLISSSSRFYKQFVENVTLAVAAKKANAAKSEFLSSMSHELRTPMNAILSLSKLILIDKDRNKLSEKHRNNLNEIVHAADHLLSLINEVLDLASIESNDLKLTLQAENLGEIYDECEHLIEPMLIEPAISLDSSGLDKSINVFVDRLKLKQVLLNLLSNAVKYNRENGSIKIISEESMHEVKISVIDSGFGLDETKLQKLFTPFDRLGVDRAEIEGTGIGLVIARNLVEKMKGKLGCESQPGKGTVFWITLPVSTKVHLDQETDKVAEYTDTVEKFQPDKKKFKVLYIEDDLTNVLIVEQLLNLKSGISLTVANTGKEALERIQAQTFDLVLLDINLPDMNGLEIAQQIKNNEYKYLTPVIALSANAMAHDVQRGKESGVDDYLVKPIDFDKFNNMLDKYLYEKAD